MDDLLDTTELDSIMNKLEEMEDEQQAAALLREFNDASRDYGKLLMNHNESLTHDEWKAECDKAKEELHKLIVKINSL